MRIRLVLILLILAVAGCGVENHDAGPQPTLPTTTAAMEYFDARAESTHDAYEQDAATLGQILDADETTDPAYVRQMQFELIVTDSKVLPLMVVEYVEDLPGKKNRQQLLQVFRNAQAVETSYYTGKLHELYDLWNVELTAEKVQELQAEIAGNYRDVEKEL